MQSVVTGQAPVTLERKFTSGGKQILRVTNRILYNTITETDRIPQTKRGQWQKTGTPGPFGAKKQVRTKIKSKTHPRTLPLVDNVCISRRKRRHVRVCLLCLTFNCFLSFRSQSEILHSSTLYAPYTNADARGDPLHLHNPRHATQATHVSACFAAAARISFAAA